MGGCGGGEEALACGGDEGVAGVAEDFVGAGEDVGVAVGSLGSVES